MCHDSAHMTHSLQSGTFKNRIPYWVIQIFFFCLFVFFFILSTVKSHACEMDAFGKPGGCSQICLLSGSYKSKTCRCRIGYSLGFDGKSCKSQYDLFSFIFKTRYILKSLSVHIQATGQTKCSTSKCYQISAFINLNYIALHALKSLSLLAFVTNLPAWRIGFSDYLKNIRKHYTFTSIPYK